MLPAEVNEPPASAVTAPVSVMSPATEVAVNVPWTVDAPRLTESPVICTVPTGSVPVAPDASRVPLATTGEPAPISLIVPPLLSRFTARMTPLVLTALANNALATLAESVTAAPVRAPELATALIAVPLLTLIASAAAGDKAKFRPPVLSAVMVATRPAARLMDPNPTSIDPVAPVWVAATLLPINAT